jgi:hypothetical protein
MNKRIVTILVAILAAFVATGSAFAQRGGGGGGGHGGGGGGYGGGGMHSGGGGYGGGGSWHGGGYNGWHGGYHGGYYGGWRGYGYGWGWYGAGLATGLYLGGPLWWGAWPYYGGYYGYGYPYYSASYSYPVYTDPPVYDQQAMPQAAPANNFWYYCTEPAGYYPYVQNCSRNWMQVVPQYQPGQTAPMPTQ